MSKAPTPNQRAAWRQNTKQCWDCGNPKLVLIRTQQIKYCTHCHTTIPWHLEPGQKSPV